MGVLLPHVILRGISMPRVASPHPAVANCVLPTGGYRACHLTKTASCRGPITSPNPCPVR